MQAIHIKPASFQVVPMDGLLRLIIDPVAVMENTDGPEMVAEVYRCLTASQGQPVAFSASDLEKLIIDSDVPPGKKLMLGVH